MTLKKIELYRGFSIFTEEVRAATWRVALVEVPASEGGEPGRTPQQGRAAGEHLSNDSALTSATAHIDRIHQNRRNRSS
ncbi:MAG: hypothetical protein HY713_10065 [candidate division NC10 bacterium]|nr:hypothetical protein [candidate division NC10 bacterium]